MEGNALNGFQTILDSLVPNANENIDLDGVGESLTDEELDELKGKNKDSKDEPDTKEEPKKQTKKVKEDKEEDDTDDDDDVSGSGSDDTDTDDGSDTDTDTYSEQDAVTAFFDTLSDKLGWDDVEADEKPKTAEELVEYFKEVIEDNSKPDYASEEVEKLDAFVRNGGNLKDYLQIDVELDLDNIKIEDDELMQKQVVRMLLREKGFNSAQIEKKINKYVDAGLLEDEAEDAIEDLKEIREEKKKELLENQQKQAKKLQAQQQQFFDNVLNEIKSMDSIYGISIPEKDKKALLEYIFKPNSKGITKYQEDYSRSLKNLVTSAYFTMKGDSIITIAKKEGKKDAIDTFKNTLNKNAGVNKRSKRIIESDTDNSIWSAFTRRLRA